MTPAYWKSLRVELAGYVTLLTGLLLSVLGAFQGKPIGAATGAILVAVGGLVLARTNNHSTYKE